MKKLPRYHFIVLFDVVYGDVLESRVKDEAEGKTLTAFIRSLFPKGMDISEWHVHQLDDEIVDIPLEGF